MRYELVGPSVQFPSALLHTTALASTFVVKMIAGGSYGFLCREAGPGGISVFRFSFTVRSISAASPDLRSD